MYAINLCRIILDAQTIVNATPLHTRTRKHAYALNIYLTAPLYIFLPLLLSPASYE